MSYFQLPSLWFWRRKKAPTDLEILFSLPEQGDESAGFSRKYGSDPGLNSGPSAGFAADTGSSAGFAADSGSRSVPVPENGTNSEFRNGRPIFSEQKMSGDLPGVSPVPEEDFTVSETQVLSRNSRRVPEGASAVLPENQLQKTVYADFSFPQDPTVPGETFMRKNSAENTVLHERISSAESTVLHERISSAKNTEDTADEHFFSSVPAGRSQNNTPVSFLPSEVSGRQRTGGAAADRGGLPAAGEVFAGREKRPAEENRERQASSQLGSAVGALTDCARAQLRYLRKNYELLRSQSEENFFN